MRRHGSYPRQQPAEFLIPRWYCRQAHQTISLLPDFAAAKVPGTLQAIEAAVLQFDDAVEQGARVHQAAREVRPDIEVQGALRWIRRRRTWMQAAFALLMGCCPDALTQCESTLQAVRAALATPCMLLSMREIAASQLHHAAMPLGFALARRMGKSAAPCAQHIMGPDPPG